MNKFKKILLFSLVFFLISINVVFAHTVTVSCESITASGAPKNSTAVLTPGNITIPGNGTSHVPSGTYKITWSDGYAINNKVVPSCPKPSTKPTPPTTNSSTPTTSSNSGSSTSTSGSASALVSASGPLTTETPTNTTNEGLINVTRKVINDSGGTNTFLNSPLFVNNNVISGVVDNKFPAPADYIVSEIKDSFYIQTFSGDCDINGFLNLQAGETKSCVITENDIDPALYPFFGLPDAGLPLNSIASKNSPTPLSVTNLIYEQAKTNPPFPVRLRIPKINVDAAIRPVGITKGNKIGVSASPDDVGWFYPWPRPGEAGSSVIDGHSGWKGDRQVVFDNLYKLVKGDKIYVEDSNGTITTFVVRESKSYDRKENALNIFHSVDTGAHLDLVSCTGIWDQIHKTHSERLVVFSDKE